MIENYLGVTEELEKIRGVDVRLEVFDKYMTFVEDFELIWSRQIKKSNYNIKIKTI